MLTAFARVAPYEEEEVVVQIMEPGLDKKRRVLRVSSVADALVHPLVTPPPPPPPFDVIVLIYECRFLKSLILLRNS